MFCSLHPVGTLLPPLSTLTPCQRHTSVPHLVMWASETAVSFSLWLEVFLSYSLTSDHRRQHQMGSVFHPTFSFGSQGAGLGGRDRLKCKRVPCRESALKGGRARACPRGRHRASEWLQVPASGCSHVPVPCVEVSPPPLLMRVLLSL